MPRHPDSDKPRCGFKLKNPPASNPEGLCRRFPVEFGIRCKFHGGNLPPAKLGAEKRRLEFEIGKAAQKLGVAAAVDNPLHELQKLAGEVLQWKNLCREHLSDLKDLGYAGMTGEQVHAKVLVWERALDRSITALATLARLNIDERLARIEEQQADMVRSAFAAGLEEIGIGPEQRAVAARTFARHLRVIEAVA